ncbi:MAG TPA: hypothetical protein VGX50_07875 [Longimicrobium sp.]|jgi:hypothetical protein|nr:hypothetical protein [Longimicrobium sp.]
MNARRIFAAAAIAVFTASGAACSGGSPTLSQNVGQEDGPELLPEAPPTDTTGFIPPQALP